MILTSKPQSAKLVYLLVYNVFLAHFFVAIGRDDALWGLFWEPSYYQDLLFVSIIVFIVSLLIYWIWNRLDLWFFWNHEFRKRLLLQILGGVILPAICSIILVYAYMSLILKQNIFTTTYFYYELPVSVVIIVMLNLVLGIHYLTHSKPMAIPLPHPMSPKPLVVQSGNSKVLLNPDKVFFVEKVGPVCLVYTEDQSKYIFTHTLDEFSKQLQQDHFFRANRQAILHKNNCKSFITERSGKLVLTVLYPEGKKITISQKKAREFKWWLTQGNKS